MTSNTQKGLGKLKGTREFRLYTAPCGLRERCRSPIFLFSSQGVGPRSGTCLEEERATPIQEMEWSCMKLLSARLRLQGSHFNSEDILLSVPRRPSECRSRSGAVTVFRSWTWWLSTCSLLGRQQVSQGSPDPTQGADVHRLVGESGLEGPNPVRPMFSESFATALGL